MILRMWVFEIIVEIMYLTKLQDWGQFSTSIIIDAINIAFYKVTRNAKLVFNPVTWEFFNLFYIRMLAFLFVIIYCGISRYPSRNKVVRPFDEKIIQS